MRFTLPILLVISSACLAQSDRSELFSKANAGDPSAQSELAFSYGHWSSHRYNSDKANFWYCLAAKNNSEEAEVNIENRLGSSWKSQCVAITKSGYEKKFNEYYESGANLGLVALKKEREETYTVPSERFWKVEWSQQECPRVCKSDIVVKGKIYSDEQKSTAMYGEFELNAQGSSSVIWLFPETEIRINIEGSKVSITEFVQ
jgi:TPR repeat protein